MPTLTFAPSKRPLRVRRRVHAVARTGSDARCPTGGGVSRSYALVNVEPDPKRIRCDMPVEVVFEKLTDEITLPLFQPAGGAR